MAENESFLLHVEDFAQLDKLKDGEAGKLLKAIILYVSTGALPDNLSVRADTMFCYIQRHIDRNRESYRETCRKRAESGRKGGRPRKQTAAEDDQEKAKKAIGFSEKQEKANESKKSLPEPDPEPDPDPDPDPEPDPDPDPDPDPVSHSSECDGSSEELNRRIGYLKTMLRLCETGAITDRDDYCRWKRELEALQWQASGR